MGDIALTSDELSDIRDDVGDLMPDTCTISLVTETADTIGYPARVYTTRASNVTCRMDPITSTSLTGIEYVSKQKNYIVTEGMYMLTLPHGTTIQETDRVTYNSQTFDVEHVDDDKSWRASVRCLVKKIEH